MGKITAFFALVLALALPSAAIAHPHAVTDRRIAKLERQVRTLRAQVNTLRYWDSCRISVVGISQYTGYLFDPDGAGPAPAQFDTALDFDPSSNPATPHLLVERFSPSCVQGGTAAERSGYFAKARG
jgi:hypothetical protein